MTMKVSYYETDQGVVEVTVRIDSIVFVYHSVNWSNVRETWDKIAKRYNRDEKVREMVNDFLADGDANSNYRILARDIVQMYPAQEKRKQT